MYVPLKDVGIGEQFLRHALKAVRTEMYAKNTIGCQLTALPTPEIVVVYSLS